MMLRRFRPILAALVLLTACARGAVTELQASPTPDLSDPLGPRLFPMAWDNRTVFQSGLIVQQHSVLEEMPGASVYHIDLEIEDDLTHLRGRQEIRYTNQETQTLADLYLRLFPNLADGSSTVSDVRVNDSPVEPSFDLRGSVMRVPLSPALDPGQSVVLRLAFEVEVPSDGGGNYGMFTFSQDILALAHFYPMVAVFDDEGWNLEIAPEIGDVVYADSSFFIVRVTAPEELVLAASGAEMERETLGDQQRVVYAAGPVRDFYIAGSDRFEAISRRVGQTTLNSYAFPEFRASAERALDFSASALQLFNQAIGVYPFSEFDIVSTPTQALGIEYPGLVVMNMRLYDPDEQEIPATFLEATTVHEVAHQWFYSVVGNDQLDEPWLDEALAQYLTLLYYGEVYGPSGFNGFRNSLTGRWARVDNAEIPIGMPVASYGPREYGAIVYGRGPLFIEELAEAMAPGDFEAFLEDYYDRHQWGIATTESFKIVAEENCDCDLTGLFEGQVYPR